MWITKPATVYSTYLDTNEEPFTRCLLWTTLRSTTFAKDKEHLGQDHLSMMSKIPNMKLKKSLDTRFFQLHIRYLVEKIVGHKIVNGEDFWPVRWKGYNETNDSWEPDRNVRQNSLEAIIDFLIP